MAYLQQTLDDQAKVLSTIEKSLEEQSPSYPSNTGMVRIRGMARPQSSNNASDKTR